MVEKIMVGCSRCKTRFREKAARVREGYQSQCPNCGKFISFSGEADDPFVRRALTEARRIRNALHLSPEYTADS